MALVHCVLEEPGAALDWLERARAVDDPNFLYWLGQPHWDCVRTHPRFRQLRHEAGLGDLDIRSPA
ncbi:MAG: hypothetical protein HY560_04115 [Gemmatimonadetes bacterium]|nr:hypothetical protein [Gemmatimonadota bacterium]